MATLSSQDEWGSIYEKSSYVAFASPTKNLADDKVLNIRYENDPVFSVLTGHSLSLDSFFNHDAPLKTCTNNIVSFNKYYAGLTFDSQILSIENMATRAGHSGQGYTDGALRIMNSEIYGYTNQNSNIIASNLYKEYRSTIWGAI
ncbi:hypothetical protein [Klebsiella sp. A-Nf5]|uniref:hypothetical protein n=1 Tax=Klebsiella sp. A-Nf5 TaxID=2054608 RepID=UPI0013FDEA1D|nr:hypothetical protein [Klebsiella sp. A-Nf5]